MSQESHGLWVFSKFYLYLFITFFIVVVLSVFIGLITDTYEKLTVSTLVLPIYYTDLICYKFSQLSDSSILQLLQWFSCLLSTVPLQLSYPLIPAFSTLPSLSNPFLPSTFVHLLILPHPFTSLPSHSFTGTLSFPLKRLPQRVCSEWH